MTNVQIVNTIKLICKQKNISITQMLNDCNITKSFIYDLEKRNTSPSCDKLLKISDYLGCSVDYLLGRTNSSNSITNGDISNSSVAQANGDNNRISIQSNIEHPYAEIIEHLDSLSPAERRHAIADIMDVLESQYPVKKK